MIDKDFIFLAGHYRSGTSLLHKVLREHPQISGFSGTGVPEDEGQHLQTVYRPAKYFGGPGKYIFNKNSYMDENHSLATEDSAKAILEQWSRHYDVDCQYCIEKSPPNLIRTRFLQKLFPKSKFVVIFRHPLAVSFATKKWSHTSIKSLLEHTIRGYEIFMSDMIYFNDVYLLRYEDFVNNPQKVINNIYDYLGIESMNIKHEVRKNVNDKYFLMWRNNRKKYLIELCSLLLIT